jgi:hypothetical protein
MNDNALILGQVAGIIDYVDLETPERYYIRAGIELKDIEKFAESIIRECAQLIFLLDAEPVSHKSAARMLLEHFGIELMDRIADK